MPANIRSLQSGYRSLAFTFASGGPDWQRHTMPANVKAVSLGEEILNLTGRSINLRPVTGRKFLRPAWTTGSIRFISVLLLFSLPP